jgi:hypothetical protein
MVLVTAAMMKKDSSGEGEDGGNGCRECNGNGSGGGDGHLDGNGRNDGCIVGNGIGNAAKAAAATTKAAVTMEAKVMVAAWLQGQQEQQHDNNTTTNMTTNMTANTTTNMTTNTELGQEGPNPPIVRRTSLRCAVYRTCICHKTPPGWARCGMGCKVGLWVSWVVEGWKHGTHPMCAIQFNSGTAQQYGIGEGEVFSILDL